MRKRAGWSYRCPCGWDTGRTPYERQMQERRSAHQQWHEEQILAMLGRASAVTSARPDV